MNKLALLALATCLVPAAAFAQGEPPPPLPGDAQPAPAEDTKPDATPDAPKTGEPGSTQADDKKAGELKTLPPAGAGSGGARGRWGTPGRQGHRPPPRWSPRLRAVAPPPYVAPVAAERPEPEGPPRISWFRLGAGFRIGYIPNAGFNAYATNDVLAQLSLDGTRTLIERRPWSLAAGLGIDLGGRSSKLRGGVDASLFAMRLTVPIEARWHLTKWMYAFGKVAPGVAYNAVSFKDPASLTPLRDKGAAFAGDLSLGASFMIGGYKNLHKKGVRFWVTPEIGYGYTTAMNVRPNPNRDDDDVTGTEQDANFGKLALRGGFWKLGVGFTF